MPKPTPFSRWLKYRMDERNLKAIKLAELSGVDPTTIGLLLAGARNLGPEAARGIARGLGLPEWEVFLAGGLLSQAPLNAEGRPLDPRIETIWRELEALNMPDELHRIIEIMRAIWGESDTNHHKAKLESSTRA